MRDTRLVAGSLAADPPLQVIERGRFHGIGRDLCSGHGQTVLNDRVERVTHTAPETLGDLRRRFATSDADAATDTTDATEATEATDTSNAEGAGGSDSAGGAGSGDGPGAGCGDDGGAS